MRLLNCPRALTALLVLSSSARATAAEKPNVVLIFVDNFGNGDLACFGSKLYRTPHISVPGRKFSRALPSGDLGRVPSGRAGRTLGDYKKNRCVRGASFSLLTGDPRGLTALPRESLDRRGCKQFRVFAGFWGVLWCGVRPLAGRPRRSR